MVVIFFVFCVFASSGRAASQDECAIWLCLPGGFPQGCASAYHEFKKRIEDGKAPLPDLSSCTTGPESSDGQYELGYERFEACKEGYTLQVSSISQYHALCYAPPCTVENGQIKGTCDIYETPMRKKPHYVKMWVDGQYLGQFFY